MAAQLATGYASELGLDWLCAGRQVHGSSVQRVYEIAGSGGEAVAIDADGHATALARVGAMVLTADCLPVALAANWTGGAVVAMAHAGWRGLAAGVLEEGVPCAARAGASGPIGAAVGPGAGVCCYEVGEEVHAALARTRHGARRRGENIDLRAIAARQAARRGRRQRLARRRVHDLRRALLLPPARGQGRRQAGRDRMGPMTGGLGIAWRG